MKLYHFTPANPQALTSIAVHGLKPNNNEPWFIDRDHVWLTTQPETSMTDEDVAHVQAKFPHVLHRF